MGVGPGHHNLAGLQRATQAVQRLNAELRYYVATTPTAKTPGLLPMPGPRKGT